MARRPSEPDESPAAAHRPGWALRLDRLALLAARVGRHVLGRPDERLLARLARRDRPGPAAGVLPSTSDQAVNVELAKGRAAFEQGRHADALFHFGVLLELSPDHPWGWHGRGDALQLLGDPEGALEAYERACALQPDEALHHGGRANALERLGRVDEARAAWARALALDPGIAWMRPTQD